MPLRSKDTRLLLIPKLGFSVVLVIHLYLLRSTWSFASCVTSVLNILSQVLDLWITMGEEACIERPRRRVTWKEL